ncbi:MAG: dihydrofolate reductase family protein [Lapillicoccus sp.]
MSSVICQLTVSLDGFVAGPDQRLEEPLGTGGERLHEWAFAGESGPTVDADLAARHGEGVGAHIMGRNMFAPGRGEWDLDWRGWWGDPPYHVPVFVLTHHPRANLSMDGGTVFHFVTDGIESALAQAREAAGPANVQISGGADTARQYLTAGLVDQLYVHVVPLVLGDGERLWDGLDGRRFEPYEVTPSPAATHIRYRALR